MKKVSVIIPVYNAAAYIENILHDLEIQTYQNIEVLVVDDGSTDDSRDIVQKYCSRDDRFALLELECKQGVSNARNQGIRRATGEFIKFCDADDKIPKHAIEYLVAGMQIGSKVDLVIGSFSQTPDLNYYTEEQAENSILNANHFAELFLAHYRTFYYGVVWNKLYKADIIRENNICFDKAITWPEDFLFNLMYYEHARETYFLPNSQKIYEYCMNGESITSNKNQLGSQYIEKMEMLRKEKSAEYFAQYGLYKEFMKEWDFGEVHFRLMRIAKQEKKNILGLYQEFRQVLSDKNCKDYVSKRIECGERERIWKMINTVITYRLYFFYFLHIRLKVLWSRRSHIEKPSIRENIKNKKISVHQLY